MVSLKRIAASLLALVVALLLTLVALMATSSGTHWLVQKIVVPLTAGQLSIGDMHGPLLGHVAIDQLHYQDASLSFTVQHVDFQWQPWQLMRWRVVINALSLDGVSIQIKPTSQTPVSEPWQPQPLQWSRLWPALTIEQLTIQQLDVQQQAEKLLQLAQAKLALMLNHTGIDSGITLDHFRFQDSPPLKDSSLQVTIKGPWTHYLAAVNAKIAGQSWLISGSGNRNSFLVNHIEGKRWPLNASIASDLQWYPTLQVKTSLSAKDLDLSAWFAAWPSKLSVDIQTVLSVDSSSWQPTSASLLIKQWQGQMRGLPVSMQGSLAWQPLRLMIDHWRLQSGSAVIQANGSLAKTNADFAWQVTAPMLGDLWPEAAGSLVSRGSVQTNQHDTALQLQAEVHHGYWSTLRMAEAKAQLDFHTKVPEKFSLALTGHDWSVGQFNVANIMLNSQGNYAQHQINLALQSSQMQLMSQWVGGFVANTWRGQWQALRLQVPNQATWALKTAISLEGGMDHVTMPQALCLQQGVQSTCVQANWQAAAFWHVLWSSSRLNLATWSFLLGPDWHMTGLVQVAVDVAQQAEKMPQGSIMLKARDVNVRYQHRADDISLNIGAVDGQAQLAAEALNTTVTLNGGLGQWQGVLRLPKWQQLTRDWRKQPLQASIKGQLASLNRLPSFSPTLEQLQGQFSLAATASGTLGAPHCQLESTVSQGSVRLPDVNIWLKPFYLKVSGDPLQQLTVTGSVQSGDGTIQIKGIADSLLSNPRVDINFQGQHFLASQLASYVIYISPDLQLTYQAAQINLTGKVVIPQAELRFVQYQKSVVRLSSDVSYVDNNTTPLNFVSTIQLSLGDKVSLQYGGLKGRVIGALTVHDEPNQPTIGSGQLQLVDSSYQAFGQTFTLSKGLAIFTGGSVANPTLDMAASRKLTNVIPVSETGTVVQSSVITGVDNDLIVGVAIKGPLKTSQTSLFSEPPGLSQADILSYMLLGRPTSEASGGGAQMLMSAASMLNNGNGASPITQLQQQLSTTLGLEVNVGATSQVDKSTQTVTQNTSVILSKALSPRLFLNYSIGIVQPVNELKITYKMTPRWSAQSETSSVANGADIFYTINRN